MIEGSQFYVTGVEKKKEKKFSPIPKIAALIKSMGRVGAAYLVLSSGVERMVFGVDLNEKVSPKRTERLYSRERVSTECIKDEVFEGYSEHIYARFEGENDWRDITGLSSAQSAHQRFSNKDLIFEAAHQEIGHTLYRAHTHPIEAYLRPDDKKRARDDRSEAPLAMPPSFPDIKTMVECNILGARNGIDCIDRVYGTTGFWEYSLQPESPKVKGLKQWIEATNARIDQWKHALPIEIKKLVEDRGIATFGQLAKENQLVRPYVEELFGEITRTALFYQTQSETAGLMEKLGLEIAYLPNTDSSESKIRAYIANAERIGLRVSYTPYNEQHQ